MKYSARLLAPVVQAATRLLLAFPAQHPRQVVLEVLVLVLAQLGFPLVHQLEVPG